MYQQRELFRIAVDRPGRLQLAGLSWPCTVVDLTDKGVRVRTDVPVAVGSDVELECRLNEHHVLRCTLHVTSAQAPFLRGPITPASPEAQHRLNAFIDAVVAANLGGV